jgi:hypothetical protein
VTRSFESLLPALAATALALVGGLVPSSSARATVFLNGVEIDGVGLNQKLEKCTVTFDGKGNVLIDAPGYNVQALNATAPVAAAGGLTKKYLAVSEGGSVGGQVDLYLNAKFVQRFKVEDGQVVLDISRFVRPGPNQILFVVPQGTSAAQSAPKVIIGEGESTANKVTIDNPIARFPRPSSPSGEATQEFSFTGR